MGVIRPECRGGGLGKVEGGNYLGEKEGMDRLSLSTSAKHSHLSSLHATTVVNKCLCPCSFTRPDFTVRSGIANTFNEEAIFSIMSHLGTQLPCERVL